MATNYVSKTGNDSNPGTEALPWLTLAKAGSTAVAGGTVLFRDGTWIGEQLSPSNAGTPGNPITFMAFTGETPIFDGNAGEVSVVITTNSKDHITIDGISVTGANTHGVSLKGSNLTVKNCDIYGNTVDLVSGGGGIHLDTGGSDILIEDNTIRDNLRNGIKGQGSTSTTNLTIRGNTIQANDVDALKDGSGDNWLIENNQILDHYNQISEDGAHPDGLQIQRPVSNLTIRYNTFSNTSQAIYIPGDVAQGSFDNLRIHGNLIYIDKTIAFPTAAMDFPKGIFVQLSPSGNSAANMEVFSNTVVDCHFGIILSDNFSTTSVSRIQGPVTVRNNIVIDSQEALTQNIDINTIAYDSDFNCVEGNVTDIKWWNGTSTVFQSLAVFQAANPTREQSTIGSDPLFKNEATFDFHIGVGSPCIGAGDPALTTAVTVPEPFLDIDGVTRTKNSGDIGAFEFVSGAAAVGGPYDVVTGQLYTPGAVLGEVHTAGAIIGEVNS